MSENRMLDRCVKMVKEPAFVESTGSSKNSRMLTNSLKAGFLTAVLALSACNSKSVPTEVDMSNARYQEDKLGLCYMVLGHTEGGNLWGNFKGFTITWVPCTPEVKSAIQKDGGGYRYR